MSPKLSLLTRVCSALFLGAFLAGTIEGKLAQFEPVWSMHVSGDTVFTVGLDTNEFNTDGRLSMMPFPVPYVLLRYASETLPPVLVEDASTFGQLIRRYDDRWLRIERDGRLGGFMSTDSITYVPGSGGGFPGTQAFSSSPIRGAISHGEVSPSGRAAVIWRDRMKKAPFSADLDAYLVDAPSGNLLRHLGYWCCPSFSLGSKRLAGIHYSEADTAFPSKPHFRDEVGRALRHPLKARIEVLDEDGPVVFEGNWTAVDKPDSPRIDTTGRYVYYETEGADSLHLLDLSTSTHPTLGGLLLGSRYFSPDARRLLTIADSAVLSSLDDPEQPRTVWTKDLVEGTPDERRVVRAALSERGRFVAVQVQQPSSPKHKYTTILFDQNGEVRFQSPASENEPAGLQFIADDWLFVGMQYPETDLRGVERVTTRKCYLLHLSMDE